MLAQRRHKLDVPGYSVSSDRLKDFDPMLFITVLVLLAFGVLTIWSAIGLPNPIANPEDSFNNEGFKQAFYGVVGIGLMFLFASIDYRYLHTVTWLLYGAGILLLVAVQSPLGVTVAGAQNWFNLGFTLIQPSEFTYGFALNLKLFDVTLNLIKFLWQGVAFHAQF